MTGDRPLRAVGAALALVTAAVHLLLSTADRIVGETTATPAFLLMGLGFVACAAALVFARERELLVIVLVYTGALALAYVATRTTLPVEAYGLVALAAEAGLAATTVRLLRRR